MDSTDTRPNWIGEHLPPDVEAALFRFKFKLPNDSVINIDLQSTTNIDYESIESELVRSPHQYVFWAAVLSEAKAMVAIITRAAKIRRGQLIEQITSASHDEKARLTEKTIMALVEKDEQLIALEKRLIKCEKESGKLHHMVKAMEMKSDNLRSLAGFRRQELKQS